jgi:hypothetical protein
MEPWRAEGRSKWRRGGLKWRPGGSARPVVADLHHLDEDQDPDPDPY